MRGVGEFYAACLTDFADLLTFFDPVALGHIDVAVKVGVHRFQSVTVFDCDLAAVHGVVVDGGDCAGEGCQYRGAEGGFDINGFVGFPAVHGFVELKFRHGTVLQYRGVVRDGDPEDYGGGDFGWGLFGFFPRE